MEWMDGQAASIIARAYRHRNSSSFSSNCNNGLNALGVTKMTTPQPDSRDRLLPCPFCGGEAKYTLFNGRIVDSDNGEDREWQDAFHQVTCDEKYCATFNKANKASVIKAWNTRAALNHPKPGGLPPHETLESFYRSVWWRGHHMGSRGYDASHVNGDWKAYAETLKSCAAYLPKSGDEGLIAKMECLKYKGELNEAQEAENLAVEECIAIIRQHEAWQAALSQQKDVDELEYLRQFHEIAQSLIGTVGLHLKNGDLEKARVRMSYYKLLLPRNPTITESQKP